ncbi:MAG: DsrE/DsrF/TusD sulfur relay family protein [Candidatus Wukongarchaeota archaeon]|nr:DsrE family protein [Candidatus Wukongarchaeota archaeon]
MVKIGIMLNAAPFQNQSHYTAVKITEAALDKGHEVTIFLYDEAVYSPMEAQEFPEWERLPKDDFKRLIEKGAEIIACGLCVDLRGLEEGKGYIKEVTVGGLADFANVVSLVDKIITFWG